MWSLNCNIYGMPSHKTSSSHSSEKTASSKSSESHSRAASHTITDHEEIRKWAESRGAHPSVVRNTGKSGPGIGVLRLDFPGYSGEDTLEPISWDQFFEEFDRDQLALLVQEETAQGKRSNFNKLVRRD